MSYQGRLPPYRWPMPKLEAIAHEFDDAACEMNDVFQQLRKVWTTLNIADWFSANWAERRAVSRQLEAE